MNFRQQTSIRLDWETRFAILGAKSRKRESHRRPSGPGVRESTLSLLRAGIAAAGTALVVLLLAGCASPIGADRVTTRQAYAQVTANALATGKPGATTVAILHRFNLDGLAARQPEEAVRQLHQQALATGERDLLFALAELSSVAGDRICRSVQPWDPRDARDYFLGSAIYAWLFLFGEGKEPSPGPFDRRFREACDFYNYGLGLALKERRSTNAIVHLQDARRRLPVGEINVTLAQNNLASQFIQSDQVLLVDQYRVRGLSVRNRDAGVGTPVMAVWRKDPIVGWRTIPATVLLRFHASLADLAPGKVAATLELHSPYDETTVTVGQTRMPLEMDLTTFRAYTMNQARIWSIGTLAFLAPAEHFPSQLILHQPYELDRIPLVFVHGTFSSPVTWAEMANSLIADPLLRHRYQVWSFIYGSGNPLVQSIADLRSALTAEVQKRDPQGTNAALRQMVVIGHSQGGLLAKATAVDTGDRIWRLFSTNRLEDLHVSDAQRAELRQSLFLQPLPFVRRVVFIATPHHGSYLAGNFARRLAQRFVSLPGNLVSRSKDMLRLTEGSIGGKFLQGRMPTSLDGMSPKNPALLALADIPVVPSVKAHSIIPVENSGDYHQGRDGVVSYQSAHVDYVESELIVRSYHSCLDQPATIEEVRRILHEHLNQPLPRSEPE